MNQQIRRSHQFRNILSNSREPDTSAHAKPFSQSQIRNAVSITGRQINTASPQRFGQNGQSPDYAVHSFGIKRRPDLQQQEVILPQFKFFPDPIPGSLRIGTPEGRIQTGR
jgi:hypothetical protein